MFKSAEKQGDRKQPNILQIDSAFRLESVLTQKMNSAVAMAITEDIQPMPTNQYPAQISFGLLPEPEGRRASFITATVINMMILAAVLYIGMMAKHVIEQHHFEQTELIFPTTPPPPPKVKLKPPPKLPDL